MKQAAMRTSVITAMPPVQLCEFRSELLTSHLNRVCKQMKSVLLFYFRQVMVTVVFFRVGVSVISLEQKINEKKGEGFPNVGWCMITTASKKSHPNTSKLSGA